MFATFAFPGRRNSFTASAVASVAALAILGVGRLTIPFADAQQAPHKQPPAKIVVDRPVPEPLTRGVAIIQFRTENLQIVPVLGPVAAKVSPRIGHLHVTLDDAPWHWVHMSNDPIIVAPLPPGPHKILIELADANHQVLAKEVVTFEVPRPVGGAGQ